jgi:hypothetical protein
LTYAVSWGVHTNSPPTTRIDSVVIRPLFDTAGVRTGMRQIFFAGNALWQRDLLDAAGMSWTSAPFAAAWGNDTSHPPAYN